MVPQVVTCKIYTFQLPASAIKVWTCFIRYRLNSDFLITVILTFFTSTIFLGEEFVLPYFTKLNKS